MWKPIALGVASLFAILIGVILVQPSAYAIERSTTIQAPPYTVYAYIADLHAMEKWSPFFEMDPAQKATYSGAPQGVGAVYEWDGEVSGKGRMTITDVEPPMKVDIKLDFVEPMASEARTVFTLEQRSDSATQVTWSMEGKNDFMGKAFSLVMDMDQMLGSEFEKGLASMKALAEAGAGRTSSTPPPTATEPGE